MLWGVHLGGISALGEGKNNLLALIFRFFVLPITALKTENFTKSLPLQELLFLRDRANK